MLRSVNALIGYSLHASDGDIGHCDDLLFDDRDWVVRYLVASTARWLVGRKIIIPPVFLEEPDWANRHFPVRLTRQQIEEGPLLDEHAPVSRQYETSYYRYFALPIYWTGDELWEAYPDPQGVLHPVPDHTELGEEERQDLEPTGAEEGNLRSCHEVHGYHIATPDNAIGHVEDFLLDDESWTLRYLVVDTRNWLPGRKVLLSPQWIESIHWVDEKVHVTLDTESIRHSPVYDPSQLVDRQYEKSLYDYYHRPYYWQ